MSNFGNYNPATFGWTKGGFKPYSYKGVRILGGISSVPGYDVLLTKMLDALVPHIPGGLKDGWCWGGTNEDRVATSFHLFGAAVDLNAPANPMTSHPHPFGGTNVLPASTGDIIRPFGFEWGGLWQPSNPPDYMHCECHLTPAEVAAHAGSGTPPPTKPPAASSFPLSAGCYFGPYSGPNESISGSGRNDAPYRPALARAQAKLGVIADGYYGPNTAAATKKFQAAHHLTVDALIGPATWKALGL